MSSSAAGRIAVRQTLVTVRHKVQVSEPKTDRGRRSVALDPRTIAALSAWRARQAQERLVFGSEYCDQDLVFSTENGGPLHPEAFAKVFDRRVATSDLPRIRFHDLRHTHASLALAAGVHPKVVSERLGACEHRLHARCLLPRNPGTSGRCCRPRGSARP